MIYCEKCLQPDTRPNSLFVNKKCPACNYHDQLFRVNWDARKKDLDEICIQIKSSKKVIAIGDSFNHDILGAMKQGFDSLFIENGIHRDDIKDLNRKKWYLSQFKPKYCQFMLKF